MAGCDVCITGPDDIENEFSAAKRLVARKAHRCIECREPIPTGATYLREVSKASGVMFTAKTCALCAEIREVFHCGSGYYYGSLWEDMASGAFARLTTASECFRELSPAAKAVVMDRWRIWKGLAHAQ